MAYRMKRGRPMKKVEFQLRVKFISSILAFIMALILVLVDKFYDWHISGLLFFSIIYIVSFVFALYKIKKERAFQVGIYVVSFLIFFYVSVCCIFVPACILKEITGVLVFLIINAGFIILAGLEAGVAILIPELLAEETDIKLLHKIFMCISILLLGISVVSLIFSGNEMLNWAFRETYAEVLSDIGLEFMVNFLEF